MSLETQLPEYPYFVKIETSSGKSTTVPVAFMTPRQIESFLQTDFKKLVDETGLHGVRVSVERATTADYQAVLREVAACLRSAPVKVA